MMLTTTDALSPALHRIKVVSRRVSAGLLRRLEGEVRALGDAPAGALVVDLSGVRRISPAGLAELVEFFIRHGRDRDVAFCGLPSPARARLAAEGLDQALPLHDDLDVALADPRLKRHRLAGQAAVILCAGLGSRAAPMTEAVPKPMFDVLGRPVIEHVARRLAGQGVSRLFLNPGHLGHQIADHFARRPLSGCAVFHAAEGRLSAGEWRAKPIGSASTLARLARRNLAFDDHTIVLCGDALLDLDFAELVACHRARRADVTIAVREVPREAVSRYGVVVAGDDGRITSFQEKPAPQDALSRWISVGAYVFAPEVLEALDDAPGQDIGGDLLPALLRQGARLMAYRGDFAWSDIGCGRDYFAAVARALGGQRPAVTPRGSELRPGVWAAPGATVSSRARITGPVHVGEGAVIAPGARIVGPAAIGAGCRIAARTLIRSSIVMAGTAVREGAVIDGLIAGPAGGIAHRFADGRPLSWRQVDFVGAAAPADERELERQPAAAYRAPAFGKAGGRPGLAGAARA